MKIVINSDFGGFSLSEKAIESYAERKGITLIKEQPDLMFSSFVTEYKMDNGDYFSAREIPRNDPTLVAVVEKLGKEADGFCATLKVVEIPEDVDWYVEEYDGNEWVAEKHRTWM